MAGYLMIHAVRMAIMNAQPDGYMDVYIDTVCSQRPEEIVCIVTDIVKFEKTTIMV